MTKPRPIHPLLPSLAVLCGSAGFAFPADAQHQQPECNDDEARIVGVIVDAATETPVAGAHASVEASDWGSLTTDNGRFLLCGIAAGIHVVTVERLGYVTLESPIEASASGEPVALPMRPDPVLLEGLEIVSDRFERRRRAVATSVRAFDQEAIASSGFWSAADFVDMRAGIITTPCGMSRCVYYRGQRVSPTVYLDEFPLIGGWSQLETIPTSQLYMVEVYRRGVHIRAYTHHFMKRAATTRMAPVTIWD
ncbi:MAG: carboxypeptidase-like regulatory domain-containing protein [Gemmatimonadetes bacterium]|nr:carboxypeptidase-like regulatory domain-containing protein [Gemmatimonadota bacterium]